MQYITHAHESQCCIYNKKQNIIHKKTDLIRSSDYDTQNKKNKDIYACIGLAMCFAVILGIASVNPQSAYAETTTIDTLEVAFKKVNVGDSLAAAFEFENETERTLKVPAGANYTATLQFVSKDG